MRDIKFRALNKNGIVSSSVTLKEIVNTAAEDGLEFNWWFNSGDVMQYTGLKDKNGVEIYEGDILGRINLYKYKKNGEVKKNQANAPEYIEVQEVKYGVHEDFASGWDFTNSSFLGWSFNPEELGDYWANELFVIGNIYENPELLNGKTNTTTE